MTRKPARSSAAALRRERRLDPTTLEQVIRAFNLYFSLANLAEEHDLHHALLRNTQMALSKADVAIARDYVELSNNPERARDLRRHPRRIRTDRHTGPYCSGVACGEGVMRAEAPDPGGCSVGSKRLVTLITVNIKTSATTRPIAILVDNDSRNR